MMETIEQDVNKIKKLLGLNGDETDEKKYYNVTDVLIAPFSSIQLTTRIPL